MVRKVMSGSLVALTQLWFGSFVLAQDTPKTTQVTADRNTEYRPGDPITFTLRFAQNVSPDLQYTLLIRDDKETAPSEFLLSGKPYPQPSDHHLVLLAGTVPVREPGAYHITKIEVGLGQGEPLILSNARNSATITIAKPDLQLQTVTPGH